MSKATPSTIAAILTADHLRPGVENVTDQVSNPFGMRPPCPYECAEAVDRSAVFGYGDANADFHVVGDHPGVHGGARTGIPFTAHPTGDRVLDVLNAVGFVEERPTDEDTLAVRNCFLSYRYCCCSPPDESPDHADYADFERFFDAELRAIAADVLVPVGAESTQHVIAEYTSRDSRIPVEMDRLHGSQVRGRGFLVVPMKDPTEWTAGDRGTMVEGLEAVLALDYHQMVDLGRFLPGGDPYFVR